METKRLGAGAMLAVLAVVQSLPVSAGDAALGEGVYRNRCAECHEIATDTNKIGPTLKGLIGRTSGTVEGFKYSDAMKAAAIVWDADTLAAYLVNPKGVVPKNRMPFNGLKRPGEAEDLVAFLVATANAD